MSDDHAHSPVRAIIHSPNPGEPEKTNVRFHHEGPLRVGRLPGGRVACALHHHAESSMFALVMTEDVARRLAVDILLAIDGERRDFDEQKDRPHDEG